MQRIKLGIDSLRARVSAQCRMARERFTGWKPETRLPDNGKWANIDVPQVSYEAQNGRPSVLKVGSSSYQYQSLSDLAAAHKVVEETLLLMKQFYHLPYMLCGTALYDRADAKKSWLYYDVPLLRFQPAGSFGSGKPMEPGVDCSGFVFNVFKKAEIAGFGQRLRAAGYAADGVTNHVYSSVNSDVAETVTDLQRLGRPGDLLFFEGKNSRRISHVAIYVGDSWVAESSGTKVLNGYVDAKDVTDWVLRYGQDPNKRGGLQIRQLTDFLKTSKTGNDIHLRRPAALNGDHD